MYKLLIVDDNIQIRNGIKKYMHAHNYSFEKIELAVDGMDALGKLATFKPDIVLTDVKMPRMNGIELARHVKKHYPQSIIIFLSAYDERDLLKIAFKLDAIDYIIKPIDFEELDTVIKKAVQLLDKENQQQLKIKKSIASLRNETLLSIIYGNLIDKNQIEKGLRQAEVTIPGNNYYLVCIVETESMQKTIDIENIIHSIVSNHTNYFMVNGGMKTLYLIFMLDKKDMKKVYDIMKQVQKQLFLQYSICSVITIGKFVESIMQLNNSFKQATELSVLKFFKGKNSIITLDDFNIQTKEEGINYNLIKAIYNDIRELSFEKIRYNIAILFNQIISNKNVSKNDLQKICINILVKLSETITRKGIYIKDISQTNYALWEGILELDTVQEIKDFLMDKISMVFMYATKLSQQEIDNLVIQQIKKIIDENYDEELNIQLIADKVYLSKSYLCTFFKSQTNETIGDYILKVRLEKAKEYLINTNYKISEICKKIGYDDQNYFTKLFKKYTDMIPTNYRKRYRSV